MTKAKDKNQINEAERLEFPERFLSDKQRLFCECYSIHRNKTQAAIEAGYSPKAAHSMACSVMHNENAVLYIKKLTQSTFEKLELSRDRVAEYYKELAEQDLRNFIRKDGTAVTGLDFKNLPGSITRTAKKFKITELFKQFDGDTKQIGVVTEIELYDRLRTLEAIRKMAGYDVDKDKDGPTNITINNKNKGTVKVNVNTTRVIEVRLNF